MGTIVVGTDRSKTAGAEGIDLARRLYVAVIFVPVAPARRVARQALLVAVRNGPS